MFLEHWCGIFGCVDEADNEYSYWVPWIESQTFNRFHWGQGRPVPTKDFTYTRLGYATWTYVRPFQQVNGRKRLGEEAIACGLIGICVVTLLRLCQKLLDIAPSGVRGPSPAHALADCSGDTDDGDGRSEKFRTWLVHILEVISIPVIVHRFVSLDRCYNALAGLRGGITHYKNEGIKQLSKCSMWCFCLSLLLIY